MSSSLSPLRVSCVAALVVCMIAVPLSAQSRRAPTAPEVKVLKQYIDTMKPILDRFVDANWEVENSDFPETPEDQTISVHAGLPLDNCVGGTISWQVVQGSQRFHKVIKPLYDRFQQLNEEVAKKAKAGKDTSVELKEIDELDKKMTTLSEVTMDLCANSPNIEATAYQPARPSILPNVIAHEAKGDDACGVDIPTCWVLAFGNWKSARMNPDGHLYDFHFVHPAASPYIENLVIKMHGAKDRIEEMLKAIDWTKVNGVLTR